MQDFKLLSEELGREIPNAKIPDNMGLFEIDELDECDLAKEIDRKQHYLEAYLRVFLMKYEQKKELIQNLEVRETQLFKEFLGLDELVEECY